MTICRTDTCQTISLLRKAAAMIESPSISDRNHARKCREMADKIERNLLSIHVYNILLYRQPAGCETTP